MNNVKTTMHFSDLTKQWENIYFIHKKRIELFKSI